MGVYRTFEGVPLRRRGIALGVFDGVHLGHQELVARLRQASLQEGLVPSAFTFSYPRGLGFDGRPLGRAFLMTEEDRVRALLDQGLEDIFLIPVHEDFCQLSPLDFLDRVIRKDLGGAILALGWDARFGYRGEGDVAFLEDYSRDRNLTPLLVGDVAWGGDKVSSSRIRKALEKGFVEDARAMMTRPFRLKGTVIPGKKLGSVLGFPTANLLYPPQLTLLRLGVYMSRVHFEGVSYPAVTSVGLAPSVKREREDILVESYLYDFSGDLYGKEIQVDFLTFIREEENFPSLDLLKDQIDQDLKKVRVLHGL